MVINIDKLKNMKVLRLVLKILIQHVIQFQILFLLVIELDLINVVARSEALVCVWRDVAICFINKLAVRF
jgi:hypothetical protein